MALAQRIAKEVSAAPERFPTLARQYSEDVATAPQGGSLGGLRASDLYLSEPVLDALAQLEVGAVSHPVETDAGFHIIRRESQPPLAVVSGAHIVINYSEARAFPETLLPATPRRTRGEALILATEVYRQAAERPETFDALVQEHSEYFDRYDGGYFGTWSRWEPTHWPREIALLASLSEGDVAPPLDSPYGLEIVRRMVTRAAEQPIAVEVARVQFDSTSMASERAAEAQLHDLMRNSRVDPRRFDDFRSTYCCLAAERWYRGRHPGFTRALEGMAVGELTQEPLREHGSFAIAKRIDLERLPADIAVTFELPAPSAPDLDDLPMYYDWAALAFQLAAASEWGQASLGLTLAEAEALQSYPAESQDPLGALKAFLSHVEARLRPAAYARYRQQLDARFEALLMKRGNAVIVD